MKWSTLISFLIFQLSTYSQNILDNQKNSIALFTENQLIDSKENIRYNIKGNIVFNKTSTSNKEIALTINSDKKRINIYNKVEKNPKWYILKNTIYWNYDRKSYIPVGLIEYAKEKIIISFNEMDSTTFSIESPEVSRQQLCLSIFYLWENTDIEFDIIASLKIEDRPQFEESLPNGIVGTMTTDNLQTGRVVWYWNNEILFSNEQFENRRVWTFDGETIKPEGYSQNELEWSWDGEELKPYWGGHPRNNWIWEGEILRQVFDSNYKNEFELVDNIARKRFGDFDEPQWEINGEMPKALIGIILLGLVNR